ncbi:squalene cyclase [Emydomyces testavorans]|uniref:Terpene cyclase/mutase family member n=1 Tax=Emydomyces testavorans TaxID=2070801 RepID=A0AAF0DGB4_9EURO|nr:squalene cyclase [Emydomyces testavorans]
MSDDKASMTASKEVDSTEVIAGKLSFSDKQAAREFRTDLTRWRLHVDNGRHVWKYVENQRDLNENPQSFLEKYWLGLPFEMPKMPRPGLPIQALENSWEFLKRLQTKAGNWGSNCDGPMFVTSGMVFCMFVLEIPIASHAKLEMCRYLINTANEDGGWGTSIETPSTVFGTTVNYIMLRMLGLSAKHEARRLLSTMGSALSIPTWGKFWLCVLGLYDWEGIVPLPAEPLLAPSFLPINPANWWMPLRNIFISMSYLYGHRFTAPESALIRELRQEIYDLPYHQIEWHRQRLNISAADCVKPRTYWQSATAFALGLFERWKVPYLRKRALNEALFQIEAEVHNTGYICLSGVNWASNLLALWHAHGPDSHWFQGMKERFMEPMWMCREGLAASGTDGTAVWDTSLTVQAICCSGLELCVDTIGVLQRAAEFLDNSQIRNNPLGMQQVYRHPAKGGWPFSTRMQGYSVSDTTAEALRAVLQLQKIAGMPKCISVDRLKQAVDFLLGMESQGGGYAAYEQVRGPDFLELFNITDSYESCMVEKRYPECTASVVMALTDFAAEYAGHRPDDISQCIERAISYLLRTQYPDGGWLGSWGICFTYATMFALEGLACVGRWEQNCLAARKACAFLLHHQNTDGGWGEALESWKAKHYVSEPEGSQVTNTAYAVIGLMAAQCSNKAAIDRGIAYIMKTQQPTGDWLPGKLEGIYVPPGGYRYPLYKFHFSIKALAQYIKRYGTSEAPKNEVLSAV